MPQFVFVLAVGLREEFISASEDFAKEDDLAVGVHWRRAEKQRLHKTWPGSKLIRVGACQNCNFYEYPRIKRAFESEIREK
jgi:hypothetical protein